MCAVSWRERGWERGGGGAARPEAARLHLRYLQSSDEREQGALRSGPVPARHERNARNLDAPVGGSSGEGPLERRGVHQNLRGRQVQGSAEEARPPQGSRLLRRVTQTRQGDVRGDRVPQVPWPRRPRRWPVASGAEGRLGKPDPAGESDQALDVSWRPGPY